MKNLLVSVFLLSAVCPSYRPGKTEIQKSTSPVPSVENLFIITTDGFRWQEVFNGADSNLINDKKYTIDTALTKMMYWDNNVDIRRKKLMPFFWNVLSNNGQLFGNRAYDNKVNVSNNWALSYPGYNEIFTGDDDVMISSNNKINNNHINVLEYLSGKAMYKGKVAAFTSWDVFPFIFNRHRSELNLNAGYEMLVSDSLSQREQVINEIQDSVFDKGSTRYDALTFEAAKEYMKKSNPKILYIGFGETDEFAHQQRYDLYLQQANKFDKMLGELWYWVQTNSNYKDKTIFVITTDHGRGKKPSKWAKHGYFIEGSSQTWLALIGPGIKPLGEVKEIQQLYQKQLAQTIALFAGENFVADHNIAQAISLKKE